MKKRAVLATTILAMLVTGCPVTSLQDVDLSARGIVSVLISRESASARAYAGASVRDNQSLLTLIDLADDQVISVNGVPLRATLVTLLLGFGLDNTQVAADIGAVDEPETYSIAFDNEGAAASMTVTPPTDFTATTPAAGAQVSQAAGFTVTWSPSDETGVLVDIVIRGLETDGSDDDSDPDSETVTLRNLPDDGTATVGASDLDTFLTGAITVTVKRFRTSSQTLGFASGEVRAEVYRAIALTLGS